MSLFSRFKKKPELKKHLFKLAEIDAEMDVRRVLVKLLFDDGMSFYVSVCGEINQRRNEAKDEWINAFGCLRELEEACVEEPYISLSALEQAQLFLRRITSDKFTYVDSLVASEINSIRIGRVVTAEIYSNREEIKSFKKYVVVPRE